MILKRDAFEAHLYLGKALALERDWEGAATHFQKATASPDQDVSHVAVDALRTIGKQ
jgi:hypothetical protein